MSALHKSVGLDIKNEDFNFLLKSIKSKASRDSIFYKMILAAEPIVKSSMDAELQAHPGEMADSMAFTGIKRNDYGDIYDSYRPTGKDSRNKDRTNISKMALLNSEQIVPRNKGGKKKYKKKEEKHLLTDDNYIIPAYDVIQASIDASEQAVLRVMEDKFWEEYGEL